MNRWLDKASIYTTASTGMLSAAPNQHHVFFALSVAQLETACGDALGGNWGATTTSALTPEDRAALADLSPSDPKNVDEARTRLSRATEILGRDYSAATGWYWIWFYKPTSPVDGAHYFVKVLVMQRPTVQMVLNDKTAPLDALARAMYATHYFLGNYSPHQMVDYNGHMMSGDEANIESYRDALNTIHPQIVASLAGWTPGVTTEDPRRPPFNLFNVFGYQAALTWFSTMVKRSEFNPGGIDGDAGPKTKAAVEAFQAYVGITQDGDVGPQTRAALAAAINTLVP